jgi:hypothetical protein
MPVSESGVWEPRPRKFKGGERVHTESELNREYGKVIEILGGTKVRVLLDSNNRVIFDENYLELVLNVKLKDAE